MAKAGGFTALFDKEFYMTEDMARVTVAVRNFQIDTRLPLHQKVGDTIADLIPFLRENLTLEDKSTKYLDDKMANWTLVKGLSTVLPAGDTLDESGVVDGIRLRLEKTSARETYPALIDDVPESIAAYQKQKFPAWTQESAKKSAQYVATSVSAAVAAGIAYVATSQDLGWITTIPLAALCVVFASLGLITAFLSARPTSDTGYSSKALGIPAAFVGYAFLTALGLVLVPGTLTYWHVVVAGVLVSSAGLILRQTTSGIEPLTYAAIASSSVLSLSAGLSLWLDLNVSQFGMIASSVGLFFLLLSPRLSMSLADIPMPYVPTVGESHVNPSEEDITKLPTSASTRAIESIVNRERQIVDAHGAIVGLTSGGIIAIAVAIAALAFTMEGNPLILWSFVMAILVAMMFRGSAFDDYMVHLIWVVGVVSVASIFLVSLVLSGFDNHLYLYLTFGTFIVAMLVFVYRAIKESKIVSPIFLRFLELVETLIYASPMVFIAIALDVYGQIRNG